MKAITTALAAALLASAPLAHADEAGVPVIVGTLDAPAETPSFPLVGSWIDANGNYWSSGAGFQQAVFDQNFTFEAVTEVPEPSTWIMFGTGVLMLGALVRARRISKR